MTRKIVYGIIFTAVLAMLVLTGAAILSSPGVTAAIENPGADPDALLLGRIEKLEKELALRKALSEEIANRNQDEEAAPPVDAEYSEQLGSIAQSLATIAEKAEAADRIADSLAAIVERLAAIEEELAWYRLDRMEEEPSEESEPDQQGAY